MEYSHVEMLDLTDSSVFLLQLLSVCFPQLLSASLITFLPQNTQNKQTPLLPQK